MTKVVTVQQALRTVFATLFSSKTEIADTINLESNDDNILNEGWGLKVGDVIDSDTQVFCQDRTIHSYAIIITKWVPRLDHDVDLFHGKLNELSEDARTARQKLNANEQLGIDSSIEIVKYTTTTSPQSINADKGIILFVEVNFTIEISEDRT